MKSFPVVSAECPPASRHVLARFSVVSARLMVLLGFATAAPPAHADGGFVMQVTMISIPGDPAGALPEPEQRGVLLHRDGVEDLYLDVRYAGQPGEFAWLVPCPARPEVSLAEPEALRQVYRRLGVGGPRVVVGPPTLVSEPDGGGGPPRPPDAAIWDLAVLPPERDTVREWLRDHGLNPSARARAVLDSYARQGWYFVGMSLGEEARGAGAEALAQGRVQPLHVRFAAAEPVFPLRVSSINPGFSDIDLYVYAEQPVRTRTARRVGWESRVYGPSRPPAGLDPDGAWRAAARRAPVLTRLRARFHAWEMEEDVYFAAAESPPEPRAERFPRRAEGFEAPAHPVRQEARQVTPSTGAWHPADPADRARTLDSLAGLR